MNVRLLSTSKLWTEEVFFVQSFLGWRFFPPLKLNFSLLLLKWWLPPTSGRKAFGCCSFKNLFRSDHLPKRCLTARETQSQYCENSALCSELENTGVCTYKHPRTEGNSARQSDAVPTGEKLRVLRRAEVLEVTADTKSMALTCLQ